MNSYLAANSNTKKQVILLSVCGASTYKHIHSICMKLVKDHYDPKPSSIVQRYKFNACTRAPRHTYDKLPNTDFKERLNGMLRGRQVLTTSKFNKLEIPHLCDGSRISSDDRGC